MAQRKQKIKRYRYVGRSGRESWRRITKAFVFVLLAALLFWLGWVVASRGVDALTGLWYSYFSVDRKVSPDDTAETDVSQPESMSESAAETIEEQQPEQQAEPEAAPEAEEGIFAQIPLSALIDEETLQNALQQAKQAGADRALLTVKDERGYIYYDSHVALAQSTGAIRSAADLEMFVRVCEQENMIPCARMYVFKDPLAAYADRTSAVYYRQEGVIWLDNYQDQGGQPWLNPYSASARQYATELASELAEIGMQGIVFAGVQFPDGYSLGDCYYGEAAATVSRSDCLAECVRMLQNAADQTEVWFQYSTAQAFQPDFNVVGEKGIQKSGAKRLLLAVSSSRNAEGQLILPECDPDAVISWAAEAVGAGTVRFALDYTVLLSDVQKTDAWKEASEKAGFTFFVQ